MGIKHKVLSRKSKQIPVKLFSNKWKSFLASWKQSKLVDEKKNKEQFVKSS